jgi:hypothetical protein
MPKCLEFSHNTTDSNGQEYSVYLNNSLSVETCGDSNLNESVIMTGAQFSDLKNFGGENFLTALMDPSYISTADYQMIFMLGLSTPLLGYMVSWAFQTVINFITKD